MQAISRVIASIARHDTKLNTAKLALLRSINDAVLAYVGVEQRGSGLVIPLRILAEFWVAYYWAFMDEAMPILQGPRAQRDGKIWNDFAFRPELTQLKRLWQETLFGSGRPSDGFVVIAEMRLARAADIYPEAFINLYRQVIRKIVRVIRYPIRYSGAGSAQYAIFPPPAAASIWPDAVWLPTTCADEACMFLTVELWQSFRDLAPWIEALCIHEWSLFTERIRDFDAQSVTRGEVYTLLTERPDNRRPLTWERNQIDMLMMEGYQFICPWTGKQLKSSCYAVDHIIPIAIYPTNELWNLVPSDSHFNSHQKRARMPTPDTLIKAESALIRAYSGYRRSSSLAPVFDRDTGFRFGLSKDVHEAEVTAAVSRMVLAVADAVNVARLRLTVRSHYNKLVRDKIPEIIQASGKRCKIETLDDEGYVTALLHKLIEETQELLASSPEQHRAELADILEVLDALIGVWGYSYDDIVAEKKRKRDERGGFVERLKLLWVE
jgi:predicted house-cleaning noncanonical NTP pyrophosphatase (MazG superfamily)